VTNLLQFATMHCGIFEKFMYFSHKPVIADAMIAKVHYHKIRILANDPCIYFHCLFVLYSRYIIDRVPSPTGDLSQRIRVRRRRRWWTTAAPVRRDRREEEKGGAGGGEQGGALQYSRLL
jgi:hypothetical protein